MKNADSTTILLKALDLELRAILTNDLEQFRIKQPQKNVKQDAVQIAAWLHYDLYITPTNENKRASSLGLFFFVKPFDEAYLKTQALCRGMKQCVFVLSVVPGGDIVH